VRNECLKGTLGRERRNITWEGNIGKSIMEGESEYGKAEVD